MIPDSRYIDANGIKIHYREAGQGMPVICLHGGGPGADAWSNFQANVPSLSEAFRLILVDMPRFGRSEKVVTDEPRLDLFGRGIIGLMDGLGLDRVAFIGNSMGGQAAMKVAADHPRRVTALAVIGSTVLPGVIGPHPAEGVRLIANYYKGEGPTRDKMRYLAETMVYDPTLVGEDLVDGRYAASIAPDVLAMQAADKQPRIQSLEDEISRIAAPTLLLWGAQDRAGPLEIGLRMLRMLPDARMHIFNRCGHWAQLEHTEEFNDVVADFIGRAARS
jgi:4,5:9,10-diseco-3-hydroxy-5,9,17-trioxoandrosta-1(10),2-diene-4-oate hydrolase